MREPAMAGVRTGRESWRRRVELSADRPFLHYGCHTWTYREVDALAARYARSLAELGVRQGTRVMVGLSNRPETVIMMVAALQLGAVEVPLQGGLTFAELAYQIAHCESSILIADDPVAATVRPRLAELAGVRTVILDEDSLAALGATQPLPWPELPGHHERSPALILYTSGSTGRPKGVVLPAGSFVSAGEAFDDRFGFGPEDNYFLPLTMAHALGIVTAPGMAVMAGGQLSIAERFRPTRFWAELARAGATASILFPTHLNLLLETAADAPGPDENGLRLVITHAWNERFRTRFGAELALVWGMTETGALCTGSEPGERGSHAGFVGRPMAGVRVEVRDDDGTALAPGQAGEIWLHHPHAMLEYLKDPQATVATLDRGWVRSGDLGRLDEQGALFFEGRIKNVIKRSGENVSAEEVENVFAALPAVSECLVFGVPDPLRSEEVVLVATMREGVDPAALLEQAAGLLVRWKLPRYVVTSTRPLPRLGNGKLDRSRIRKQFDPAAAYDRER